MWIDREPVRHRSDRPFCYAVEQIKERGQSLMKVIYRKVQHLRKSSPSFFKL